MYLSGFRIACTSHTYGQVEGMGAGAHVAFFWQIIKGVFFTAFNRTSLLYNSAQLSNALYYVLEYSKYKQNQYKSSQYFNAYSVVLHCGL